jgi:hypothetical protein
LARNPTKTVEDYLLEVDDIDFAGSSSAKPVNQVDITVDQFRAMTKDQQAAFLAEQRARRGL